MLLPYARESLLPYQSVGVGMLNYSTLMGVFPSTPPSMEVANVNMFSTTGQSPRGKEVVESSSLGPHKALYDAFQSTFDVHSDDIHVNFRLIFN